MSSWPTLLQGLICVLEASQFAGHNEGMGMSMDVMLATTTMYSSVLNNGRHFTPPDSLCHTVIHYCTPDLLLATTSIFKVYFSFSHAVVFFIDQILLFHVRNVVRTLLQVMSAWRTSCSLALQ